MLNQLQPLLTQAKAHKKGRKAKSRPIFVSRQLEVKYAKALHTLIDEMHAETLKQLLPLTQNQVGDSKVNDNKAVADGLLDKFWAVFATLTAIVSNRFFNIALPLANEIVNAQKKASDKQLGELLKKQTGLDLNGLMTDEDLKDVVDDAVKANVNLIKSIPKEYLDRIEKSVMAGVQSGTLNRDLAKELEKIEGVTKSRANLIATDQLGKINSRISQIRQQKLGITHYIWRTSHDERVRHSHRVRDGQLIAWDNPPNDGHAGFAIRCRCVAEPYTEHLMGGKKAEDVVREQNIQEQQQLIVDAWVGNQSVLDAYTKSFQSYKNPFGLTIAEYSAIRHYTGAGSADLNDVLNGFVTFDDKKTEILQNAGVFLAQALDKLPDYNGVVVRRIDGQKINLSQYQIGSMITLPAFSSTTYSTDDVFKHRKIRLVMFSKTGKKIDDIAVDKSEKEVLFSKDKRFFVVNIEEKQYYTEITLKETD